MSTEFPPLDDELRPRARLKKHSPAPVSDEEIEANSLQLGEKWGASTSISTDQPPPAASAPLKPPPDPALPPLAPVTSIRGYIPQYLDDELAVKAAERRVTKTFLIMEALAKAGYRVEENDMVQDRRKRPKGS
jgi:hypothetical protein